MYCLECRRKVKPFTKQTNYLGNREVSDWKARNMHKMCWKLKQQRINMVEYMQHRGFLDKNKVYEI